jgi:branched-subunit amino acid ABC-type transport system permease component
MAEKSNDTSQRSQGGSLVVVLAGVAIILIALFQTVDSGAPDRYTIGALLALALGGGVGRVADTLVKSYVQSVIESNTANPEENNSNGKEAK